MIPAPLGIQPCGALVSQVSAIQPSPRRSPVRERRTHPCQPPLGFRPNGRLADAKNGVSRNVIRTTPLGPIEVVIQSQPVTRLTPYDISPNLLAARKAQECIEVHCAVERRPNDSCAQGGGQTPDCARVAIHMNPTRAQHDTDVGIRSEQFLEYRRVLKQLSARW